MVLRPHPVHRPEASRRPHPGRRPRRLDRVPRQHASSSADRASPPSRRSSPSALGVPIVVSCANGTDALLVALQAVGVKRGMKVALPNLTFWATFEAVAQLGAVPVLVDIDPDDLHVSLDELRSAHDAHRFDALHARPPVRLDVVAPPRDSCILQGAQRRHRRGRRAVLRRRGVRQAGARRGRRRDALVLPGQGGRRRDGRRRHHDAVEGARGLPPLHLQPRPLRSLLVRARRLELAHGRPPGRVPVARPRSRAGDPRVAPHGRRLVPRAHHVGRGARQARSRLRPAGRASSRTATSTCSPSRASAARRSSTR